MTSQPRVPDAPARVFHSERLSPPPVWHLLSLLVGVSAGLLALPLANAVVALAVGVATAVMTSAVLVGSAPVVRVTDEELVAGEARIDRALLGAPEPLDEERSRAALGPDLDARAYVVLRSWCRTSVRVPVLDPADPTPYWLVSTRRPELLARALAPDAA